MKVTIVFLVVLFSLVKTEFQSVEQTITTPNCTSLSQGTAIALSIVLPYFGVDRFYMDYVVLGILKMFVFWSWLISFVISIVFTTCSVISFNKASKQMKNSKKKKKKKEEKEMKEVDLKEREEKKEEKVDEEKKEKKDKDSDESDPDEKSDEKSEGEANSEPHSDPDSDDENAPVAIKRRRKKLLQLNILIWFCVITYGVLVFIWFFIDFILITTGVLNPAKCNFNS